MGINSETRVLTAGDLAVCSSGDIHYYDSKNSQSKLLMVIFNPSLIGYPAGWPLNMRLMSPFLHNSPSAPAEGNPRLPAIMQELLEEYLEKPRIMNSW